MGKNTSIKRRILFSTTNTNDVMHSLTRAMMQVAVFFYEMLGLHVENQQIHHNQSAMVADDKVAVKTCMSPNNVWPRVKCKK